MDPNPMSTSNTLVPSADSARSSESNDGRHFIDLEAARNSRMQRKGSTASRASRMAEDQIYPDLTEEERELRRIQTLEEMKRIYSRKHEDETGELEAPDDAGSLVDVDPELVTWDGPDDPENPRNFPNGKKWGITMIISLYTFITPFASSVVAPAAMVYGREFGITDPTILSMSVSIFLLGFAIGPLFFAPLSEMYGRLIVMQISTFIFLFFTIGASFSQNTETMIVLRFFGGLSGSAPLALGAGILSDVWSPMELARASAIFSLGPLIGPITAPIMSGFVVQYLEWRWVFWILSIVVGATAVLGALIYRTETYAIVILNRRAARLRKETGNPHLHTVFETTRDFKTTLKIAIFRPFKMLATNPILFCLGLFMAFVYGFLYLMFVTFPSLFQGVYGQTSGMAGLNYLGPGVGFLVGIAVFTPLMQVNYKRLTEANGGVSKPEYRLPVLFYGAVLIPGGLFWYGWSAEYHIHWIMPLIGAALFCAGMMSVFVAIQTYLIDMSPRYAASAVSAATVFRSLFGFAFPLFGGQLYDKLGYGWGNSLLGFIAIPLGLVFPVMIYKFGEPLRIAAEARLDRSEKRAGDRADARSEKRSLAERERNGTAGSV